MPKRVQRKRTKGWRMPPNTVYVGRGSKWGNPFGRESSWYGPHTLVGLYRDWILGNLKYSDQAPSLNDIRRELRGKGLACWCPLARPCHADVLLELANQPNGTEKDNAN